MKTNIEIKKKEMQLHLTNHNLVFYTWNNAFFTLSFTVLWRRSCSFLSVSGANTVPSHGVKI